MTQSPFLCPTTFGDYGGVYAPETLMASLIDLETAWSESCQDVGFQSELTHLLETYAGRATPLHHAKRMSKVLGLELWLKREDLLHTGAHKINNSLGQALLAKRMGKTRILCETGAGQHGVATATVCALLDLRCVVYMGAVDAARQQPNVQRMKLLGAEIQIVEQGQSTLKDAINEALRAWVGDPHAHYLIGSALGPHPFPSIVAEYQSIIGREAHRQFDAAVGGLPDVAIACVGGGSNAIGLFRGFEEHTSVKLIGVEAGGQGPFEGGHAARFQGGRPGILHGCETYLLQDTNGNVLPTSSVSAGLDYPAVGPEHAALHERKRASYVSCSDREALQGFQSLARLEGILPALESSHAVGWVITNAKRFEGQQIILNLSGRGDKDLKSVTDLLGEQL